MFNLVLVELIRLGGHRVLATEPVAAELERIGQVRRLDAEPGARRQPMRFAASRSLGGSPVNMRPYYGE